MKLTRKELWILEFLDPKSCSELSLILRFWR